MAFVSTQSWGNVVKTFFGRHEGKLETFAKICVAASLETLREDPTVHVRDKQADWKLLSEISRTAPVCERAFLCLRYS